MKATNNNPATANPCTPYTITTPRGAFKIRYEFASIEEARAAGFGYYFTNDDGREILTRSHFDNVNIKDFATITPAATTTESPATTESTTANEESKPAPVGIFRDDKHNLFIINPDASTHKINADELAKIIADEKTPAPVKLSAIDIQIKLEQEKREFREKQENFDRCQRIADELDELASGQIYKCPHCGALVNLDFEEDDDGESVATCSDCKEIINEDDAEPLSAWEYFEDCLDIEYITDAQKQYKAVKICIAWGGPSIYVDTDAGAVCLYWWGQSSRAYLSTIARDMVDEWAQSYFEI